MRVRLPLGAPNCESGEMVYSRDLKSLVFGHAGSSPASRTKKYFKDSSLIC